MLRAPQSRTFKYIHESKIKYYMKIQLKSSLKVKFETETFGSQRKKKIYQFKWETMRFRCAVKSLHWSSHELNCFWPTVSIIKHKLIIYLYSLERCGSLCGCGCCCRNLNVKSRSSVERPLRREIVKICKARRGTRPS